MTDAKERAHVEDCTKTGKVAPVVESSRSESNTPVHDVHGKWSEANDPLSAEDKQWNDVAGITHDEDCTEMDESASAEEDIGTGNHDYVHDEN